MSSPPSIQATSQNCIRYWSLSRTCGSRYSHDYGKENIGLNSWNHLIMIVSRASLLPWLSFIQLTLTFILHFLCSYLAPIFAFSLYFWASSPGWHHTGYGNCSSLFIWSFNKYLLNAYYISGTGLGTWDTQLNKKNKNP